MENKCEAVRGGNSCNRDAEFEIIEYGLESKDDVIHLSCTRCLGIVFEQHEIDKAEVERL